MVINRVAHPERVRREVALHTESGVLVDDGVARALAQTVRSDGDPALRAMALGAPFAPDRVDLTGMDSAAEPDRIAALRSWLRAACARHHPDRTNHDTAVAVTAAPFPGSPTHVW